MKNKYFGTDGFRGEVNVNLTAEHAYKIGRFLGWYFTSDLSNRDKTKTKARIVIGKDTRRSSYMLEYALCSGIIASGGDAYILHVTTTPSVSYIVRTEGFDCGIMITASHNPFYDNGIKLINRYGEKFDDVATDMIEKYIDGEFTEIDDGDLPLAHREQIGAIVDFVSGRNRYIAYLISLASHSYRHLRIGLDCANGAVWSIARAVFEALGAQTYVVGDKPDGVNINEGCGSTHIENLRCLVKENHLDIGFAFDGDGDRCIAVDEKGNEIDGDKMMYILAHRLKSHGMLRDDTVVATIMSNSGFVNSLEKSGLRCELTTVGDRFVYERMQEKDYDLGGEQSGHIIIKKYATTGDGLLTAIMITEELCDKKLPLSKLAANVSLYPQYVKNIRVKDKKAVTSNKEVLQAVSGAEKVIGGKGRVLLRESGTEPVIRVMIECESEALCVELAEKIAQKIEAST